MFPTARYLKAIEQAPVHQPSGVVVEVVGLLLEVGGMQAKVGDILQVASESANLDVEVTGFRGGRLLATPLGDVAGVHSGARVVRSERGTRVAVGANLLGRIVDAFGEPLDRTEAVRSSGRYPVHAAPPAAVSRRPI